MKVYVLVDIESGDIEGVYSSRRAAEEDMADDGEEIQEYVVDEGREYIY